MCVCAVLDVSFEEEEEKEEVEEEKGKRLRMEGHETAAVP